MRISIVDDGKTLVVEQYTRGLPPTRIPVEGGVVDFDNRFGTNAKCGPTAWAKTAEPELDETEGGDALRNLKQDEQIRRSREILETLD